MVNSAVKVHKIGSVKFIFFRLDDDSEDVFGDFEDLEMGETYTSTAPDEVTQFAQNAINKAKQQERREQDKKSKKQSFNNQVFY